MKKKGVELSMNVIIIAAIGLLVLVILAVLVVNSMGKTQNQLKNCAAVGGICKDTCGNGEEENKAGDCSANVNGKNTCCTIFVATGGG